MSEVEERPGAWLRPFSTQSPRGGLGGSHATADADGETVLGYLRAGESFPDRLLQGRIFRVQPRLTGPESP